MDLRSLTKSILRASGYDLRRWPQCRADAIAHLLRIISHYEIECVIDVGANIGQFGSSLREVGYKGEILSFEPVSSSFAKLAERARGDANWYVQQLALGDSDSTAQIQIFANPELSSFLKPNDHFHELFGDNGRAVGVEEVEVRRLDSIFDTLVPKLAGKRLFLKLDTQGYDLRVVAGAGRHIGDLVGLMSELSVSGIYQGAVPFHEALMQLQHTSFEISGVFPVELDEHLRLIEFDCLMLNPKYCKN